MRYAKFLLGLILVMVGCTEHRAGHSESEQGAANEQNKAAAAGSGSPEFSVNVRFSDATTKKRLSLRDTSRGIRSKGRNYAIWILSQGRSIWEMSRRRFTPAKPRLS